MRKLEFMLAAGIAIPLLLLVPVRALVAEQDAAAKSAAPEKKKKEVKEVGATQTANAVIWTQRDTASLDLIYGSGGKEHAPTGSYKFVEEDLNGTSAKFVVTDDKGVKWKVKMGAEPQSETAATRLVWAAGYFVDEDYYLPEIHVDGLPKLKRGAQYASDDGTVRGVRMERSVKGQKKMGNWNWYKNPFSGTKELYGLRVMMALIGNWDLKEINNVIYSEPGSVPIYVVADLGATFGKTGNYLTRSKNSPEDFEKTKFIQNIREDRVDFYMNSRPFILTAVDVGNYATRTKMQEIAKNVPRTDAKWLGGILAALTDEQIRDCFRAAGYAPDVVDSNAAVIKERITDLNAL